MDVATAPIGLDLRQRAREAVKGTGAAMFALADTLARIDDADCWRSWGFESFQQYLVAELELSPKTGYELIAVRRRWFTVWNDVKGVHWNRLVEAQPLLASGTMTAAELLTHVKDPACTVRKIRELKQKRLPLKPTITAPPPPPDVGLGPDAHRDVTDRQVLVFPGLQVLQRWIGNHDGQLWIRLGIALPEEIVTLLGETLNAAAEQLDVPVSRILAGEVSPAKLIEAVCQEALSSWRVPTSPDPDTR